MSVPMPPTIVLMVCKVLVVGEPHPATGAENLEWDTTDSVMHCRRIQMDLMDGAELQGADPRPFNQWHCQRAILMQGVQWNERHKSSKYRFWRGACPTKVVDTRTGEIIAWHIPDCGSSRWGRIVCEQDIAI